MQIGDVYRDKLTAEQLASSRRAYGNGPFQITRITREQGLRVVYVKSLENGRPYGPWADPGYWGVLDVFLTAAHKANQCK